MPGAAARYRSVASTRVACADRGRGLAMGPRDLAAATLAALALVGCSSSNEQTAGSQSADDSGSDASEADTTTAPVPTTAELATVECWDDAAVVAPSSVECFTATVPADPAEPEGQQIVLPVAVLSPPEEPTGPPTVYLDGGPGGDGLTFAEVLSGLPVAETNEVVIIGQRGSLHAQPSLMCPEVIEETFSAFETGMDDSTRAATVSAFERCRDRLDGEGIDVEDFTTVRAADDVEAVRRALGHDSWNIYGISYGTRLALEVMRRHPESVDLVVLDSVYPPDVEPYESFVDNAERAFGELAEDCEADPSCEGDLFQRMATLYDRLEAEPVPVTTTHPVTGEQATVLWDGDRLAESAFGALYRTGLIPILPSLLASFEQGDFELATSTLLGLTDSLKLISDGLFASIECSERAPGTDADTVEEIEAGTEPWLWSAVAGSANLALCDRWDTAPVATEVGEPVASDSRVLILAGDHDPITPPSWGDRAAGTLPNATMVELAGHGHGVSIDECGAELTAAFLADPEAPLPAEACEFTQS